MRGLVVIDKLERGVNAGTLIPLCQRNNRIVRCKSVTLQCGRDKAGRLDAVDELSQEAGGLRPLLRNSGCLGNRHETALHHARPGDGA